MEHIKTLNTKSLQNTVKNKKNGIRGVGLLRETEKSVSCSSPIL